MPRAARILAALSSFMLLANAAGAETRDALLSFSRQLTELYDSRKDAVVKVKVAIQTKDEDGKDRVALTVLSGFYIDEQGTVLTNAVPLQEGARIRVEKNNVQLLAIPIAADTQSNLSILQIAKPPEKITYIELADLAEEPQIGSIAFAITSPLNFEPTPKLGLVTGKESSFSEIEFPFTYTRVSISSGPAEGGSPVFNASGDLIGISVASLPDVDSSYIVPTKALRKLVDQLRNQKKATYPSIKAKFAERGNPIDHTSSIIVTGVENGSAAEKSGLQTGDQVIEFEGLALDSLNQLRDELFFSEVQRFASLTVIRGKKQKEIPILLEARE